MEDKKYSHVSNTRQNLWIIITERITKQLCQFLVINANKLEDNLSKLFISSLVSLTCTVNDKFKWLVIFITQLPHCQQSAQYVIAEN